ncbi:ABC transporter permease [Nocardia otitidiscaviarum]|uniref:ABC transporter permease n=1 Tax=Nocardia otitidiscaviarum TaxID=1823 RepID=UPI0004A73B98|nr:ABC transporter permease [Nocardia otitidiscaviarum]MBF6131394.1 ABC transporter permease [Nocardia otitidiscaviarum]MBF6489190.1 ABC transporter permease [Nocardia otitidiscaviarum]
MFVALRDLRAARGRFLLITLVVTMVALLVSFLSGLTSGLAHQNISAVQSLRTDTVVFADTGGGASFDASTLTAEQVDVWQRTGGTVDPIGISRTRATAADAPPTQVALFGVDGTPFGNRVATASGEVVLSSAAAKELHAHAGDTVELGSGAFTVRGVTGDDWYAHTPVVWMTLSDWQALSPGSGAATILAVSGVSDLAAANAAAHTITTSTADSLSAMSSYEAENGSLTLMTVMLFAISALVIGAFFTVWTIQRTADIATLKALGATTGSLVRDALGQALVVLLIGVGLGVGGTALASLFLGDALPFVLSVSTTLFPAVALIVLGLLGAAFALRFLVTTDPLTALNQAR